MSTLQLPTVEIAATRKRVASIDILRGAVIVLMVLDHVRDFLHVNAYLFTPTDLSRTNVPLFFTRWVTHFCAPVFVFLAGLGAYLHGTRIPRRQLSFFLFTRGIVLIIAECTIISAGWTFAPYSPLIILQVIWAIGFSMIVLSLLVYLPLRFILAFGIILVAGHNLLDGFRVTAQTPGAFVWSLLHQQNVMTLWGIKWLIIYPVLPWIGIMALGYTMGSLYTTGYDPGSRKKLQARLGGAAIIVFILLRFSNLYGDPFPWSVQKSGAFTLLSFINTFKYPPSLLYTLMTLGPACLYLAYSKGTLNPLTRRISVFGRVPMFFYVLHVYLVHLLAMIGAVATGYKWSDMVLPDFLLTIPQLKGFGFDIVIVYMAWILVLVILYPLCKRFAEYKRMHPSKKWLSYF
jgi:uncharacterized membrane protein